MDQSNALEHQQWYELDSCFEVFQVFITLKQVDTDFGCCVGTLSRTHPETLKGHPVGIHGHGWPFV